MPHNCHANQLFVQQFGQGNNEGQLCITGLLWGESTGGESNGHQSIPLTKGQLCGKLFYVRMWHAMM